MTKTEVEKGLTGLKQVRIGTTSSSPYLGFPTFEEVPFLVEVGQMPAVGTYIVIERDNPSVIHYGRITEGTEDNIRADPTRLQQNQAYQIGRMDPRPGDQSPHVTRVMTAEVLGEIHLGRDDDLIVKEPNLLAQTGKGVYELPAERIPWLLDTAGSVQEGFHIGSIESAGSYANFVLPMEIIARHLAVVGKTGVGKSYAIGVLTEELVRHGIPVVSFDVLGDVVNAAQDLKGTNFTAGENFKVPYSVIGLSEFLGFVPNLTHEQSELVALAYDDVFGEALNTLDDRGGVAIPLARLTNGIADVAGAFGQAPVGGRAVRRVQAAVSRNRLLSETTGKWLSAFANRPITNVFVGHLRQNHRNLVVGATARMLQALRRRGRIPPFVFILDEAHLFLPGGGEVTPSTRVIRELVRTARHDAIGVILVTQSPSSMDRQTLLTCNTRLVFALDQEDLRVVSGTMGDLPEKMVARIPKLPKGNAVASSGMDLMRHPAFVRIRQRKTREGAPTPNLAEEVRRWRRSQA